MPDTYTTYLNGRVVSRGISSLAMAESTAKIKVMMCKLRFSTAVIVSALIGRIERVVINDANGCRSFDPNDTTTAATLPLSPPSTAAPYPTTAGVVCRCHERTGFCPAHGPTGPAPEMQV